jgi:hypothetical protein
MAMGMKRMLLIGVAGWALWGCGGDASAMGSVEMCFEDAPLLRPGGSAPGGEDRSELIVRPIRAGQVSTGVST